MSAPPPPPPFLNAWDDGDWSYYVRDDGGSPEETVRAVDDPAELLWERRWLRPVAVSSLDPDERPEGCDTALTRDRKGRFQSVFAWEECGETIPSAVAYYGVRYKPADETLPQIVPSGCRSES